MPDAPHPWFAPDGLTVATLFGWRAGHRFVVVRDDAGRAVLLLSQAAGGSRDEVRNALLACLERFETQAAEPPQAPAEPKAAADSAQVREFLDALQELGWSQARLARRLEVDPNTVSRWVSAGRVPAYAREYLRALVLVKRMGRLLDD
jgi:DNA-binding transcriptional regulator YiaG